MKTPSRTIPESFLTQERPFTEWDVKGLLGAPCECHEQLTSTNIIMRDRVAEIATGTVLVADQQTQGRGRFTRTWISPPQRNLYFSMALRPQVPTHQWAQLTQVAAITLAQLLQQFGLPIAVKWPNDLLWNRHKLCGLLAERVVHHEQATLILGIGLNVNSPAEDFKNLDRLATSLSIETQRSWNREILLQTFLKDFEQAMLRFEQQGLSPWLEAWTQMTHFIGSPARVVQPQQTLTGTIRGIRADGSLAFELEDGTIIEVYSGDLEI